MAKIVMTFDTVEKTCSCLKDGEALDMDALQSLSFYKDRYTKGDPWTMNMGSVSRDEDNDMVTQNYVYARLSEDQKDGVKKDIGEYIASRLSGGK